MVELMIHWFWICFPTTVQYIGEKHYVKRVLWIPSFHKTYYFWQDFEVRNQWTLYYPMRPREIIGKWQWSNATNGHMKYAVHPDSYTKHLYETYKERIFIKVSTKRSIYSLCDFRCRHDIFERTGWVNNSNDSLSSFVPAQIGVFNESFEIIISLKWNDWKVHTPEGTTIFFFSEMSSYCVI